VKDNGSITDLVEVIKSKGNQTTALHSVAAEAISTLICPVYGDFYSFPWKRGPHDNIIEYTEALATFASVREITFNQLKEFDFVSKFLQIFQAEDEGKNVEVKCSILRFFAQLLRSFDILSSQAKK